MGNPPIYKEGTRNPEGSRHTVLATTGEQEERREAGTIETREENYRAENKKCWVDRRPRKSL